MHAFVPSHLDYCNALYLGVSPAILSFSRLQLVQSSVTRLLTGIKKREHIAPVLINLHWLQYLFNTEFITKCCYTYVLKALHGLAPEYVADFISLH